MVNPDAERALLGHITGVSGLKGWPQVHSDTDPRENIVSYPHWWVQQSGSWRKVGVLGGRPQGKTIVVQIDGVTTPEQASLLIGATIAVDRDAMPQLGSGEYYWADLAGMQVKTLEGVVIGPVSRLFETGANDVLVVSDERESPDNQQLGSAGKSAGEVLVPWLVPDVITEVDMTKRTITIDWDPDF